MSIRKVSIVIFVILISSVYFFSSCGTPEEHYPSLKVVNQYEGRAIESVSLVGYDFNNLDIAAGDSQRFFLNNGMQAGYQNINITVRYGSGTASWFISNAFDFSDGSTTIITLNGSSSEGHPYYNNTCLE
ncbi:MAG: hypothetical protein CVV48_01780 [Spirochaetae bacterium HGW-Spirochaetae-4]|jgi:hypothetical protein|nr:MAG: hypothetical protein CVV48_01780 [Spirochaetae bacterium HGW-Spirochaetae-4]